MKNIKIEEVVKNENQVIAIARESPFYPDGKGGQLGDRGKIGPARVLKVKEKTATSFTIWTPNLNRVSTTAR